MFGSNGAYFVPDGIACSKLTSEQKKQAVMIIDEFNKPISETKVEALYLELKSRTIQRNSDNDDYDFKVSNLHRILSKYPADIVYNVFATYSSKWFPCINDIENIIREESSNRKELYNYFLRG